MCVSVTKDLVRLRRYEPWKLDVWSCGAILFFMVVGEVLYRARGQVSYTSLRGTLFPLDSHPQSHTRIRTSEQVHLSLLHVWWPLINP